MKKLFLISIGLLFSLTLTSLAANDCSNTVSLSDNEKDLVIKIYGKGTGTIINKSDEISEIILCSEDSDEVCVTLTKPVNSKILIADLHNNKLKVEGDPLKIDENGNILLKGVSIGTFENIDVIIKNAIIE
ncbi:MAG: hypothetical protein FWH18_08125 [Marinilabiliaceae bacterium]|nr:hypothetical protein [Marinilabiliaceae bacterium]